MTLFESNYNFTEGWYINFIEGNYNFIGRLEVFTEGIFLANASCRESLYTYSLTPPPPWHFCPYPRQNIFQL